MKKPIIKSKNKKTDGINVADRSDILIKQSMKNLHRASKVCKRVDPFLYVNGVS